MKNMRYLFVLISAIFFVSCHSTKEVFFHRERSGKNYSFQMKVPKKFIQLSEGAVSSNFALMGLLFYIDDSVIYISDDKRYGPNNNNMDFVDCSTVDYPCKEGTLENGRLWKEIVLHNFIITYHNIPKKRKKYFDVALESFTVIE